MGLKLEDFIKGARKQGWRVEETKSGFMFYPADPTRKPVLAHRDTPEYSLKKTLSQLRQGGFQWPAT